MIDSPFYLMCCLQVVACVSGFFFIWFLISSRSIAVLNGCQFVFVIVWFCLWASGVSRLGCFARNKTGYVLYLVWSGYYGSWNRTNLFTACCNFIVMGLTCWFQFYYVRRMALLRARYSRWLIQVWYQVANRRWCWVSLNLALAKFTWLGSWATGNSGKARQVWRKRCRGRMGDAIWVIGIGLWVLVDTECIFGLLRVCKNIYSYYQIFDQWNVVGFQKQSGQIKFEIFFHMKLYGRSRTSVRMSEVEGNRVSLYPMISSDEPNKNSFYESFKLEL